MMISKHNDNLVDSIALRCDCMGEMLVIDKYHFNNDVDYNISIQDSNISDLNTIKGRIKSAIKCLTGKPRYFNDIYIENESEIVELNRALSALIGRE